MTIFKRGDGVYWYDVVRKGERYRKSTGVKNYRDAQDIQSAFITALAKGDVGITERKKIPTFKSAIASFLEWSRNEHQAKPATHRRYVTSSVPLLRFFSADTSLVKITPDEVERYKVARLNQFTTVRGKEKQKQTQKRVMPATVNRELACLRATFNHVMKGDVPLRNPINAHDRALRDSKVAHFRIYDARHTWATRAAEAGIDLVTLAAMLGHSKINMVLRYAHPTQEHQAKAMDKFERFVAEQQIEAVAQKQSASRAIQ